MADVDSSLVQAIAFAFLAHSVEGDHPAVHASTNSKLFFIRLYDSCHKCMHTSGWARLKFCNRASVAENDR